MFFKNEITYMNIKYLILTTLISSNLYAQNVESELIEAARILNICTTDYKLPIIKKNKSVLNVTATAYTSHVNQTDSTPNIAAWGDRLAPGMKVIAVSRDLLNDYGMKHNTKVTIDGLDGVFLVKDKMNKRWKKKIDIYMGKNLKNAFKWGNQKVTIRWTTS